MFEGETKERHKAETHAKPLEDREKDRLMKLASANCRRIELLERQVEIVVSRLDLTVESLKATIQASVTLNQQLKLVNDQGTETPKLAVVIEYLHAVAGRDCWCDDKEWEGPQDYAGGNIDDAYAGGVLDGGAVLAREILEKME